MSSAETLHELLLHQAKIAPEIYSASSLEERTERSLCLARSYCHGNGSHPTKINWSVVDFVLGGTIKPKNEYLLSDEHSDVIRNTGNVRTQMRNNLGALVSKVELQIPHHHTYPVLRPVWVGKLAHPAPSFELRRRSEGEFAVTLKAPISEARTGTGPIEHRYFGDSNSTVPVPVSANGLSVAAYGFVLSAHGIEHSDENYPMLVYGKENILSVVGQSVASPTSIANLHACLDQVGSPLS